MTVDPKHAKFIYFYSTLFNIQVENSTKQALLCSIELGSIKCNLETAKIGILVTRNRSHSSGLAQKQ